MKPRFTARIAGMLAVCMAFAATAYAQEDGSDVYKEGDRLFVRFTLDGGDADLSANDRLTVTPVVAGRGEQVAMPPVVFTGRIRHKVDERMIRLYGMPYGQPEAFQDVVLRRNEKGRPENIVAYQASIPYEAWMDGGQVVLQREMTGCAGRSVLLAPLAVGRIAVPRAPRLTFLLPQGEPPKRRSEQITAVVHFPQGRSVLFRDFADNARQLDQIDSLTERLWGNDSLTIEEVYLKGYASPEDTYAFNTRLSANRVKSLKTYLCDRHSMPETVFVTATEPEDWDSLRRWVVVSDMPYRDDVLAVIDTVPNPDARDAGIWRIDNGRTYLALLNGVYPQLRRVDYRIGYTVPPFTEEQTAYIIRTNPQWLSLTEMCRLAERYPLDSPEREYICSVALQQYPNDPCACNNMAQIALRRGDAQLARQCLAGCADDPRVQNNLGVLYLMEGDREAARRSFLAAEAVGDEKAAYNLHHFRNLTASW